MNRQQAQAALAALSPAARAVFDNSELDDADDAVIAELRGAGLVETSTSFDWSELATAVDSGLKPRTSVDELLEHLAEEDLPSAVDSFDAWNAGTLAEYNFDETAARAIIADAAAAMRAAYDGAIQALAALPAVDDQAAAA